jgi:hypothetical protein
LARNWPEGVKQTGRSRSSIAKLERFPRARLRPASFEPDLPASFRIYSPCGRGPALRSPSARAGGHGGRLRPSIRHTGIPRRRTLPAQPHTSTTQSVAVRVVGTPLAASARPHDLISGRMLPSGTTISFDLAPYQSAWISD